MFKGCDHILTLHLGMIKHIFNASSRRTRDFFTKNSFPLESGFTAESTVNNRHDLRLLRGTLGFDGLILTDDLEMKAVADRFEIGDAAVRAVEAGCDILLVCKNLPVQIQAIDGLSRAIASGRISQDRLAQSRRRLELVLNTHAKM